MISSTDLQYFSLTGYLHVYVPLTDKSYLPLGTSKIVNVNNSLVFFKGTCALHKYKTSGNILIEWVSDMWGMGNSFRDFEPLESLHHKFFKETIGVNYKACSSAYRSE